MNVYDEMNKLCEGIKETGRRSGEKDAETL